MTSSRAAGLSMTSVTRSWVGAQTRKCVPGSAPLAFETTSAPIGRLRFGAFICRQGLQSMCHEAREIWQRPGISGARAHARRDRCARRKLARMKAVVALLVLGLAPHAAADEDVRLYLEIDPLPFALGGHGHQAGARVRDV